MSSNPSSLWQILFRRANPGTLHHHPTICFYRKLKQKCENWIHHNIWNRVLNLSSIYKTQVMFGNVESMENGKYETQVMRERLLFYQKQKRMLLKKAKEQHKQEILMDELARINFEIFNEIDMKQIRRKTLGDRVEFWKLFFKYLFAKKQPPLLLHAEISEYDKYKQEKSEEK
ncbi:hypothetical protein FDP41_000642 [Naegleria fowleri]|uniref:Uncharacterized protein n=1 Tax=Naegleria fowleri TaxID=5763 RepID=A0A6A5C2U4_NAEFO|nr:uncharacterized protein FDP41_000642 [Naegleria fowleri]KAF0984743.1 hypothetical protein FDP41_000642 [Naegleria fowleri]CAG4716772.1 unnamed protein product [Naegleria fowleri]